MFSFAFRFLFVGIFFLFSSFSEAIFNLETKKEGLPANSESKYWLLVSQGCHSCSQVLTELKRFCSGKKPPSSNIGFFAIGSISAISKKLEDFKGDYEIFLGSTNEFHESYRLVGSPSLKIKNKRKAVVGKDKILKFLKKDSEFCSA